MSWRDDAACKGATPILTDAVRRAPVIVHTNQGADA